MAVYPAPQSAPLLDKGTLSCRGVSAEMGESQHQVSEQTVTDRIRGAFEKGNISVCMRELKYYLNDPIH